MKVLEAILEAFRGRQRKPTLILLFSAPLLLGWKYFASPQSLAGWFEGTDLHPETAGAISYFISCFVLLGVLPALIVKLVFRERLRDYGLGFGIPYRTRNTICWFCPVFLLAAWLGSADSGLAAKFPINPTAGESIGMFALHAATYLLFYLGWEFFFRGFLLFGLRESMGDANAVLVQALVSALMHIGDPTQEAFGAILAGILWGMLALRTGSIFTSLCQHYTVGLGLDAFLCLKR